MPATARTCFLAGIFVGLTLMGGHAADQAPATAPTVDPGPPVQGDWVVKRIDSDIDTLNPLIGETDNGQWIAQQLICEGLLHLNDFTLKIEPNLAETWEISPDQLTYTFHLRHGVRFHDGQPMTAEDVKFSYDKLVDPKVDDAPVRSYFTHIIKCEVLDPYTVRFTTNERYFKTLEVLGTLLVVLPKHYFDKEKVDFNSSAFGRHPIGTGPYKFVKWDTGSHITIERNDDYWQGPVCYPKRVIFQIIEEPYVAGQLLKKGEIDCFDRVSPVQWKYEFAGKPSMKRLRKIVYPVPAYSYFGFNLRAPLFGDIRVRHAIDLLMPRPELLHQVYLDEYASYASGFDPPSSPNYNHDVLPTPYDPGLAKKLLADAGWKSDHGDGFLYKDNQRLTFSLLYPSGNATSEKIAELMQQSLAQAGIEMTLSRLQFAQLIAQVNDWKFDAVIASWGTDIDGDPSQLWASSEADLKKSSNFIGYKNAEVDKLIAQGKLEYDPEKRAAIFRQVHKIIHDDYPVCFLFNPQQIVIISDRYQNVKVFPPRPCFDVTKWWVPKDKQVYKD